MTHLFRSAIALAFFSTTAFSSTVIDLGTSNVGNWSITGAGATGAAALANTTVPGTISITTNSKQDGTFLAGGSLGAFNGFWYADFMFALPGNAINIILNFSALTADDRVVLQLNGTDIGNEAVDGEGLGLMNLGGGDNLYTFSASAGNGSITTGFNVGGLNLVRMIVNNTGTGRTGSTQTFVTPADGTAAGLLGTVSYDSSIPATPEPGSISLILLGLAPLAWRLRRRP
jgi:hypothetical protein